MAYNGTQVGIRFNGAYLLLSDSKGYEIKILKFKI